MGITAEYMKGWKQYPSVYIPTVPAWYPLETTLGQFFTFMKNLRFQFQFHT
jgi:hypothetical protein